MSVTITVSNRRTGAKARVPVVINDLGRAAARIPGFPIPVEFGDGVELDPAEKAALDAVFSPAWLSYVSSLEEYERAHGAWVAARLGLDTLFEQVGTSRPKGVGADRIYDSTRIREAWTGWASASGDALTALYGAETSAVVRDWVLYGRARTTDVQMAFGTPTNCRGWWLDGLLVPRHGGGLTAPTEVHLRAVASSGYWRTTTHITTAGRIQLVEVDPFPASRPVRPTAESILG